MEVLEWYLPKTKHALSLPWKPLRIMPLGDIQYNADNSTDLKRLKTYIDWGLKNDYYFIGMGDFIDFSSPSGRTKLRTANLYDSVVSVLDLAGKRLVDDLMDILGPTKGRWLGMLEGHHFHQFSDGITSDQLLCQLLDARFLGTCAMIRLTFADNAKHRAIYKLWGHHGETGATTPGGAINKLLQAGMGCNADMFLMGHVHKILPYSQDQLDLTNKGVPHLVYRTRHFLLCGSFMRGYTESNRVEGRPGGGYVEKKMLLPSTLGALAVTLVPTLGERGAYVGVSVTTEPILEKK